MQSAYHGFSGTEKAFLKILTTPFKPILQTSRACKHIDLSAAFQTVDYGILAQTFEFLFHWFCVQVVRIVSHGALILCYHQGHIVC